MRLLTGSGTPRRWAGAHLALCWLYVPLDKHHLAVWIAILDEDEPLPVAAACFLIETADG